MMSILFIIDINYKNIYMIAKVRRGGGAVQYLTKTVGRDIYSLKL